MARVPQFTSKEVPSGQTGETFLSPAAANVGAGIEEQAVAGLGQDITGLGLVLGELKKREENAEDILTADQASAARKNAVQQYDKLKSANPNDPDIWEMGREQIISQLNQKVSALQYNNPDFAARQDVDHISAVEAFDSKSQIEAIQVKADKAVALTTQAFTETFAITGNEQSVEKDNLMEALTNQLGPELTEIEFKSIQAEANQQRIATLIRAGEFDQARDLTATTPGLEPDQRNAQLKFIDTEQERIRKKTEDLGYSRQMEVNTSFTDLIADDNLTPDMVQSSNLDDKSKTGLRGKLSKEKWQQYVAGSTDKPPTQTTADGFNFVTQSVFDFTNLKLNTEGAYKNILDARYLDKSITDTDYDWAMNRIKNPYKQPVAFDIQTIIKGNNQSIKGEGFLPALDRQFFSEKEQQRAANINTQLIRWVDEQIALEKTPTRKQMYDKSAELIAQDGNTVGSISSPKTKTEWEKLPFGAEFRNPSDGKIYRKERPE
jgi:hypothetical protein